MSTVLFDDVSVHPAPRGLWGYISPSRLNCWLSCPRKFKIQYVDGHKQPTTSSLFLGKIVHAGMEVYHRHLQLGVTLTAVDLHRQILEIWGPARDIEQMLFDSPVEEQALQRQALNLVGAYLLQAPHNEKPLAVETTIETPLIDPLSGEDFGIPLLGIIDLIIDNPEGPLIADFKTSARSNDPLEVMHDIQLTSYAYLVRHSTGHIESGLEIRSLIKTKTPKIEFHRYPTRTEAHFRRLFEVIRVYLDDLDRRRFIYRPGFGCGMCAYRDGLCRA